MIKNPILGINFHLVFTCETFMPYLDKSVSTVKGEKGAQ